MKVTGLSVLLILGIIVLFSGCVQITINVPPVPGATPATTAEPTLPPADQRESPTATITITKEPAGSASPEFIVPVGDTSRVGHRSFTFNYAPDGVAREYTVRIPINMSVYYGARQTKISLPANGQDPAAIRAYISSFESDPSMEELYSSVLEQLRNVRYQNGEYLSDDQYLEMIVAFVQQIPYVENPSSDRKYPVEVIYDKSGDSDEKSLLLANLLAREGYDVSLLVYEDLGYEATGIRVHEEVPDASLKIFTNGKKDYVFVDAGVQRFIGSVPDAFVSASDPGIYPIGNGTKSYGPINYVWKIVADLKLLNKLSLIDKNTVIHTWDKYGTCSWIKNSKLLHNTTCYCCDM